MHVVFYGQKYHTESGGLLGMYYDEVTGMPVSLDDFARELVTGVEVHIRPATEAELAPIEAQLAILKARASSLIQQDQSLLRWIDCVSQDALNNEGSGHAH